MELPTTILLEETYKCPYGLNGHEHIVHSSYNESFSQKDQIGMTNYICDQLKKLNVEVNEIKILIKKVLVPVKTKKPKNIIFFSIFMVTYSSEEINKIDLKEIDYEVYKTFITLQEKKLAGEFLVKRYMTTTSNILLQ